jgi:phage terminase large subunit GpA-like protein
MTAEAPLPCPFCGGAPRMDLAKKTYCQLHGEPAQAVRVYCYHSGCDARPSVSAGDVFNGGEVRARAEAIERWNRRPATGEG